MKVNIWTRIGNVVYICLLEEKILDFNTLFESTKILPWKDYCSERNHVSIEVNTYNSQLEAGRSIQAIVHKAVAESV
jgi:putative N6-adenine-specific DNA methylase